MSIEAGHWARVVCAVNAHAEELHPNDKAERRRLVHKLLCITTREDIDERLNKVRLQELAIQEGVQPTSNDRPSFFERIRSRFVMKSDD